jgi:hypothetical protein
MFESEVDLSEFHHDVLYAQRLQEIGQLHQDHRQVQLNAAQNINEISLGPKILLIYLIYQIAELGATISVLVVSRNEICPQVPLRYWIILFTGRIVVLAPLTVKRISLIMKEFQFPPYILKLEKCIVMYTVAM